MFRSRAQCGSETASFSDQVKNCHLEPSAPGRRYGTDAFRRLPLYSTFLVVVVCPSVESPPASVAKFRRRAMWTSTVKHPFAGKVVVGPLQYCCHRYRCYLRHVRPRRCFAAASALAGVTHSSTPLLELPPRVSFRLGRLNCCISDS